MELSQKSSVEVVDVMQVSEVLEAMVELVKRELLVVEEIKDVELVLRTSVGKCVGIVVEVMP